MQNRYAGLWAAGIIRSYCTQQLTKGPSALRQLPSADGCPAHSPAHHRKLHRLVDACTLSAAQPSGGCSQEAEPD